MGSDKLEDICKSRFPENGAKLFEAIKKIAHIDFYVTLTSSDHEISIAVSTGSPGTIFKLTKDYQRIWLANGNIVPIERLDYGLIKQFLQDENYK